MFCVALIQPAKPDLRGIKWYSYNELVFPGKAIIISGFCSVVVRYKLVQDINASMEPSSRYSLYKSYSGRSITNLAATAAFSHFLLSLL